MHRFLHYNFSTYAEFIPEPFMKDCSTGKNDMQTPFNALWHNDTIWRHIFGSPMAKVMAPRLTASTHIDL